MSQLGEVSRVKAVHKSAFLDKPNVVGVGIGYKMTASKVSDELSLVVLVRQKIPLAGLPAGAIVPREVDGIRTDVLEVGDIRPLKTRRDQWRPAPGGVSLGHYKITAGTLGCLVRDRTSGERLILSNNHVLANINDALQGDPILQPGPADGGDEVKDVIARLERFVPLHFNLEPPACNLAEGYVRLGNALARFSRSSHRVQVVRSNPEAINLVDAAVARPIDDSWISADILEIGAVNGTETAVLGMGVRKSGRTTEFTTGEINVLDTTVVVSYGLDRSASFEGQIVTSPMSQGGDSGSLLVSSDAPLAVGLLFAGSNMATIHNPIQSVLDLIGGEIISPQEVSMKAKRQATLEKVQEVRQTHQDWLLTKPNVVGVGVGLRHKAGKRTDQLSLVVMVDKKVPKVLLSPEDLIPDEIDGVPIDVKETGSLEAA